MRVLMLVGPALNEFSQQVLQPFISSGRHALCGCAIDTRPAKPLRERLWDNLRRGRGGYVFVMAATLRMRRRGGTSLPTKPFCERHGIPVIETDAPYAPETVAAMRALEPDVLILLGGYGIVKEPLLSLAAHGVVSYHHGDMRRYRGMPPAFWELYNGERQMGVTVQRLGASLDAGEPIVERTVAIRDEDTVRSLRKRAMDGSVDMLFEAVQRLEQPAFRPAQIDTFGPLYTLPTLRQWLTVTARVGARRLRALARRL